MSTAQKTEYGSMSLELLFEEYQRTPCDELKWEIVLRHTNLIKCIASQARGVYSSFAEMDDIINEGLLVLADAVDKYDPERGAFSTYVSKRVRGMIIDLARRYNWIPRLTNQRRREINQAISALKTSLGRYPTDHEIAEQLGITDKVYHRRIEQYAIQSVISWEELFTSPVHPGGSEPFESPEQRVEELDTLKTLADSISALRENQQTVLGLYYQEGLTMGEIAEVMGITRSRVCQIHKSAVDRLKVLMEEA